ncbi:MAG: SRPBCC family protein [Marinilabiliaceae bacterium]|jgi:effector-binding domain-containing protein|nr:SRPBCC family protein [Marinilabiliaceae bacterium]
MKALKWILIVIVSLAALIVFIGLLLPKRLVVSASADINISTPELFYSVATFTDRQAWDPWLETEPEAEVTISSQPDYVGSTYEWKGEKLGNGRMLVDSVFYPSFIKSSIWFMPEMEPAEVNWQLEPAENGTKAVWSLHMESANPFMKLMNRLMKGGLEKSFEKGLGNLKTYIESGTFTRSKLDVTGVKEFPAMSAVIAEAYGVNMEVMSQTMEMLFGIVMQAVTDNGLTPSGMPFAYYFNYNQEAGTTSIKAGVPVNDIVKLSGEARTETFKAFKGFSALHTGPYTEFELSYGKMMEEMNRQGIMPLMESWEFYHTDPGMEPDESRWLTEIVFMIAE